MSSELLQVGVYFTLALDSLRGKTFFNIYGQELI